MLGIRRRRIRRRPVLLAAGGVLGVSLVSGAGSAAGANAAMSQPGAALSPSPSNHNTLLGVGADSATDAWAVGWDLNESTHLPVTLTLHWNGTSWSKVKSPNPDQTFFLSSLSGVSAVSPTSAWAAGEYYKTPSGPGRIGVILHWNGTTWSRVNGPHPGRSFNQLLGVSADSPTDAWAAGNYGQPDSPTQTLALHGNGTAWSQASSPSPSGGDNQLNAVTALSPTDAWAVGEYSNTSNGYNTLILHWNGMGWSQT